MLSKLTLLSRYMLVTSPEQAKELIKFAEDPNEPLRGMLVILDSNLVLGRRTGVKLGTALLYLITQSRKRDIDFLIVGNKNMQLDKRIDRQLTHSSKIVSKEWPQEVTL